MLMSRAMGRVSGWGWSFGYFGGMLALGLSLAYVISAQSRGQTAEQTRRDRYECHNWAVEESGESPVAGGVTPSDLAVGLDQDEIDELEAELGARE